MTRRHSSLNTDDHVVLQWPTNATVPIDPPPIAIIFSFQIYSNNLPAIFIASTVFYLFVFCVDIDAGPR